MPTIVDLLSNHNTFATRRLLEACRALSEEDFKRDFQIGCGSLHRTFLHIIGAMQRWADRIADRPIRPSLEQDPQRWNAVDLLDLLRDAAKDLHEVVSHVRREKRLHEIMSVHPQGYEQPFTFTRGSAIVHVFTHGVHHRAQALHMLKRLGVQPLPEIDAIDAELAQGKLSTAENNGLDRMA